MNIAIITFSDFNTNYGSILQAVALKTYLEKKNHNVTFIRYREFNKIKTKSLRSKFKYVAIKLHTLLNIKQKKNRETSFRKFINDNLNHTKLYTDSKLMQQELNYFDTYICGSDQIWNKIVLGGIKSPYFLDFAPSDKIKISYAASLGEYIPSKEDSKILRKLLNNLNFISCRETESIKTLKSLTSKKIFNVLDPVFLLDSIEWDELSQSNTNTLPKHEYGICYFVRRNKFGKNIINSFKKKYHIPIYNISDNLISFVNTRKTYSSANPFEFIQLIKNAKFCIGSSFHLAAFSIIFNKPFYICSSNHNINRLQNITSLVNCNNNIISDIIDINNATIQNLTSINDYSNLNQKIALSKAFIEDSLKSNAE